MYSVSLSRNAAVWWDVIWVSSKICSILVWASPTSPHTFAKHLQWPNARLWGIVRSVQLGTGSWNGSAGTGARSHELHLDGFGFGSADAAWRFLLASIRLRSFLATSATDIYIAYGALSGWQQQRLGAGERHWSWDGSYPSSNCANVHNEIIVRVK